MRSVLGGESDPPDDNSADLIDPILQRSGRLERTLRYFIAQDAIEFALKEPPVYKAIIERTKRNLAQYTISASTSPHPRLLSKGSVDSGSTLSQCSHRTEEDTEGAVLRKLSYASHLSQNSGTSINHDNELKSTQPQKRIAFRSQRSLLITLASCLLTIRSFTAAQKLGMIWGGYGVLIPYALVSVFITCPLLSLELALGNMMRGGLGKMMQSVSPGFRLVMPITVFGLAVLLGTNALYIGESFTILRESIGGNPGWLARQAITLDCEQTKPAMESCVKKAGCIYLDYVCKIDPVYWARAHLHTLTDHWQTGVITSVVTWTFVLILQALRLKPITTFVGTSTLLGFIALFYLCYQENAQIQAENMTLNQHPSLIVMGQTVSYAFSELSQAALWLTMSHQSLRSVGIGMGINPLLASLAPAGTNVVRAAIILTIIDVAATAGFVSVNHALLKNLASKTGQSVYLIMKDMPDLIEVVLPATVGNVPHKKFVLALIVGSAIVAQIASITILCFCFARIIMDTRVVQRLRLGSVTCKCLVTLAGFLVTVVFLWSPVLEVEHAAVRDIFIIVAYLESLAFGWLKYLPEQKVRIGALAAYGVAILFTAFLSFGAIVGLPILVTMSNARLHFLAAWTYTLLPLSICLTIGVLAFLVALPMILISAYRYALRHPRRPLLPSEDEPLNKTDIRTCTSEFSITVVDVHRSSTASVASDLKEHVKWKRLQNVLWWSFLGNIELLRFDINSALTGTSAFRLDLFWSISIKYLTPFWLLLLIFHDAADSDGSTSGNLPFKYHLAASVINNSIINIATTKLIPGYFFTLIFASASIGLVALVTMFIRKYEHRLSNPSVLREMAEWTSIPRPVVTDGLRLSWASLNAFFFNEFFDGREGSAADEIARPYSTMASKEDECASAECGRFIEAVRSGGDGTETNIYKRISTALFHKVLQQNNEDAEQIADRLMRERQLDFSLTALCEEENNH